MAMFSNLVGRRYKISESLGKPLFIIQPVEAAGRANKRTFWCFDYNKNHGKPPQGRCNDMSDKLT
jgi:hypothetical protein